MGTRSWLQIVRRKHTDVYLWAHWDGHWEKHGVGGTLCDELHKLLAEMTQAQLCEAIEALRVTYWGDEDYDTGLYRGDTFQFKELANVLRRALGRSLGVPAAPPAAGAAAAAAAAAPAAAAAAAPAASKAAARFDVYNDRCEDVEYTYTLDAYAGVLKASGHGASPTLTFEFLRAGGDFVTAFPSIEDTKTKVLDMCRSRLPVVDFKARKATIAARIEATIEDLIGDEMTEDKLADYYLKRAK